MAEIKIIETQARGLERSDPVKNGDHIFAMVRGGLVLLSSHLEAYIKGLIEITLQQIHRKQIGVEKLPQKALYFASQDLVREIIQTTDPQKIASKLLLLVARDGPNLRERGPLVSALDWDVFEQGFSTPKVAQIERFLKRVGYETLARDLGQIQRNQFQIVKNAVDHLVDTRNAIAHGDQNERKTPRELAELRKYTQTFCRDLDDAYCNWCKGKLCSIRI